MAGCGDEPKQELVSFSCAPLPPSFPFFPPAVRLAIPRRFTRPGDLCSMVLLFVKSARLRIARRRAEAVLRDGRDPSGVLNPLARNTVREREESGNPLAGRRFRLAQSARVHADSREIFASEDALPVELTNPSSARIV